MAEVLKPGHTELRFHVPDELVAVLDAKSLSLSIPRNRYCIRILRERAVRDLEEHMVMARVLHGNPAVLQGTWNQSEPVPLMPNEGPALLGSFPNAMQRG